MKLITRNLVQFSALIAISMLVAGVAAKADVINLTVDSAGNLRNGVGVATKDEYGLGNNNPTSNLTFLNAEISLYNAVFNPDLPLGTAPVLAAFDSLGNSNSYTSIGGYDYLVIHYGAGQAQYAETPVYVPDVYVPAQYNKQGKLIKAAYTIPGHFEKTNWEKSEGGWWQAYYIGGLSGIVFTVPIPGPDYNDLIYNGKPVGGFSSARYYNGHNVPEGGATVVFIGLGLLVMTLVVGRPRLHNV